MTTGRTCVRQNSFVPKLKCETKTDRMKLWNKHEASESQTSWVQRIGSPSVLWETCDLDTSQIIFINLPNNLRVVFIYSWRRLTRVLWWNENRKLLCFCLISFFFLHIFTQLKDVRHRRFISDTFVHVWSFRLVTSQSRNTRSRPESVSAAGSTPLHRVSS